MKYKAVIFDLDGVICFTDHYHYLAWKQLADKLGVPFDETINDRLRGVSRMESLDIILEKSSISISSEQKLEMAENKNNLYREFLYKMSSKDLTEEVSRTLHSLRDKKCLLAIGSSSKNTPLILERIGLDGFFDAISDGNSIARSKPDPEVFLNAAGILGLSPSDCLVVEDAGAGIEAAIAGGFDSAAIGAAASLGRATYNLNRFDDLLKIVEA